MTDPITLKLWQLVSAVVASSAISGTGAVITMRVDQAVNNERITQNTIAINENAAEMHQTVRDLQKVANQLTRVAAVLDHRK